MCQDDLNTACCWVSRIVVARVKGAMTAAAVHGSLTVLHCEHLLTCLF